jgi:hypothetical protein
LTVATLSRKRMHSTMTETAASLNGLRGDV